MEGPNEDKRHDKPANRREGIGWRNANVARAYVQCRYQPTNTDGLIVGGEGTCLTLRGQFVSWTPVGSR